jgi:hypothetical protein
MVKKTATLDEHFDETLRRVRAAVRPRFKCVADAESFDVPANWPDRGARAAVCAALRDSFRRGRVIRDPFWLSLLRRPNWRCAFNVDDEVLKLRRLRDADVVLLGIRAIGARKIRTVSNLPGLTELWQSVDRG